MNHTLNAYAPFRPKHALRLAAPQTWAGSLIPVLISFALACHAGEQPSAFMTVILLAICVLMQSSVNAFDDYFDYVSGLDTESDLLAADDSVLAYDHVNPKCALAFACSLLIAAFALGVIIIAASGLIPLIIALIGACIVLLYSGGKTPISSLPIGEVVSGLVMGILIPLACTYVLFHGRFDPWVIIYVLPVMIGIGLIMMTNNTCDIDKDEPHGRKTLPVILGRSRARKVYHVLLIIWMGIIIVLVGTVFTQGAIIIPFMVLASFPFIKGLWLSPLDQKSRIASMSTIACLNVTLGAFYALCIIT